MPHVLVIEDHPLFRQAMVQLIRSTLAAETSLATDAEQGLQVLQGPTVVDLVVMDLGLPGTLKGRSAVEAVRQVRPGLPILVVSGSEEPEVVQAALAAGADAYLVKTASTEAFGLTLRQLVGSAAAEHPAQRLTERQREILALLCEGLSNKEIGRKLDLSDATVKMHMTAVLRGLGVSTRTQAVLAARQAGLDTAG